MSLFGKKDEGESVSRSGAPDPPRTAAPPSLPGRGQDGGGEKMANIGKSISIKGDLTGNEDLVLEGKVEGKVELPNNQLTIGANGTVKAEIQAKSVVVIGKVTGNVRGTERIEIQATGVVDGDVSAPKLVVAEGAVLNGSIQMSGKPASAAPAPAPQAVVGGQKAG
jgi:cytoskeletal protein CcmA (bactofilin family)